MFAVIRRLTGHYGNGYANDAGDEDLHDETDDVDDVEEDQKDDPAAVQETALQNLFVRVCEADELDLAITRHIIRKCRRLRLTGLVSTILDNLDFLSPAIPDVALYLIEIANETFLLQYSDQLYRALTTCHCVEDPLVAKWMHHVVTSSPVLVRDNRFASLVRNRGDIGAQAALAIGLLDNTFARNQRTRIVNLSPTQVREVVRAEPGS